jgi:hypothetical protein
MAAVAAIACLVAMPAAAISRYESMSLTCREAQARIIEEGAVVLRYPSARNPSLTLYDRYVESRAYCQPTEYARAQWIPTADTHACPVYHCKEIEYDDDLWPR